MMVEKVDNYDNNYQYDGGIPWNDKDVNIQWPIEGLDILLSEKDKKQKKFKELDLPFVYEG